MNKPPMKTIDKITLVALLLGSASITCLTIANLHTIINFIWSFTK